MRDIRGYLLSEDGELKQRNMSEALACLAALSEGAAPTPEQWAGMFHVLNHVSEEIRSDAAFVQEQVSDPGA